MSATMAQQLQDTSDGVAPAEQSASTDRNKKQNSPNFDNRTSFYNQVVVDGVGDLNSSQHGDVETTRAMDSFSDLIALYRTGNEIDREALRKAFGNSFDPSVVMLTPSEIIVGCSELNFEDIYEVLNETAKMKFQLTIQDMICEDAGIFHFLVRFRNMFIDGNFRAMAYSDDSGKIVYLEIKKANVARDCVVQNLNAFLSSYDGTRRKCPNNYHKLMSALYSKSLVVETNAGKFFYDSFYQRMRKSYRQDFIIKSFKVSRHVMGVEYTIDATLEGKSFGLKVRGQTEGGKLVHICAVETSEDKESEDFSILFAELNESKEPSGVQKAFSMRKLSFMSVTEKDLARQVIPLPDQLRSHVLGEGTEMIPAKDIGRIVKVSIERPLRYMHTFGLGRLQLLVPTDRSPYAGGAYLTENWFEGKFTLHVKSGEAIASCCKVDNKTFDIRGRYPLFPKDKKCLKSNMYPWYRLERSTGYEFQSHVVSVWNGTSYDAIWNAHQKHSSTEWLPVKSYTVVIESLSGDATIGFVTNAAPIKSKLFKSWQIDAAPGVDPALIVCIATCM